jgi:hypothetical protein
MSESPMMISSGALIDRIASAGQSWTCLSRPFVLFDERGPVVRIRRDSQIFLFKRRASQVFRLQLINPGEQPRVKPVAVERYGNDDQLAAPALDAEWPIAFRRRLPTL